MRRASGFDAHGGIELARPMVGHRVRLCQRITMAFLGDDVQKLRAAGIAHFVQGIHQCVHIMAIHRADVVETQLFKNGGEACGAARLRLDLLGQFAQRRRHLQYNLAGLAHRRIKGAAEQLAQIAVERTHGRADRHVVVVEDHQHARLADTGVVHGLVGHARRHGAVADDGYCMAVRALVLRAHGHPQSGRDAGRRMGGAKGVVLAFAAPRKTAQAALLAQGGHALAPPGQNFVRIGLVAHVPDQPVLRRVVDIVQGHRQLDGAQIGAEMPPGLGHAVEQKGPQLSRQSRQLRARQTAKIGRPLDRCE